MKMAEQQPKMKIICHRRSETEDQAPESWNLLY
jgi:hypothetical protein